MQALAENVPTKEYVNDAISDLQSREYVYSSISDLAIDTSNLASWEYAVNNIVDTSHFVTREYVDNIVREDMFQQPQSMVTLSTLVI